jgi:hypothetical protein
MLASSEGDAGAAGNSRTTVTNPSGAVIPKANLAPWPVQDNRAVYAGVTTTASNSRVSVVAYYRA